MSNLRTIEDLVRRCQQSPAGDTSAFEQIVALCSGRVFATAYRILGDAHEAEDQTQEVFIKVYRSINAIDDPTTFLAWLKRIVTNTCLDAIERQQRRPQIWSLPECDADDELGPTYTDTRTPSPEEAAIRHELRQTLAEALAQLDPNARAILQLRDIEERSYQEIAERMDLGLSAVKMRIRRARLSFQKLLEPAGADPGAS